MRRGRPVAPGGRMRPWRPPRASKAVRTGKHSLAGQRQQTPPRNLLRCTPPHPTTVKPPFPTHPPAPPPHPGLAFGSAYREDDSMLLSSSSSEDSPPGSASAAAGTGAAAPPERSPPVPLAGGRGRGGGRDRCMTDGGGGAALEQGVAAQGTEIEGREPSPAVAGPSQRLFQEGVSQANPGGKGDACVQATCMQAITSQARPAKSPPPPPAGG